MSLCFSEVSRTAECFYSAGKFRLDLSFVVGGISCSRNLYLSTLMPASMGPRRRVAILAFILVLSIGTLGIQWATADTASGARTVGEGPYPGNTLISVQTYKSNDGRLIEVTPDGKTVWELNPSTKSRVFDGEKLKNQERSRRSSRQTSPEAVPRSVPAVQEGTLYP